MSTTSQSEPQAVKRPVGHGESMLNDVAAQAEARGRVGRAIAPPSTEGVPLADRPRRSDAQHMAEQASGQADRQSEYQRRTDAQPLDFRAAYRRDGGVVPGLVIHITGGGLAARIQARKNGDLAEHQKGEAAALAAADKGEERRRLARVQAQLAEAERLLAEAQGAKAKAQDEARRLLTAGEDPTPAERRSRQAALDEDAYEQRLETLRPLLAQAERGVEEACRRAVEAHRLKFRAERKQAESEAYRQLLADLEPLLTRLIDEFHIDFADG